MSRITKRIVIRNDADEPCCAYLDDQLNPLVEIPLHVLADLSENHGVAATHLAIIHALTEVLGKLTEEERAFALRP